MSGELEKYLLDLEKENDNLIHVGKALLETLGMTEFTLFCTAILNRTINMNRGFITLINDNNYIAAAPLVRMNLDSLLRLFASSQSEYDFDDFAKQVRKGKKIDKMLDSKGKLLLRDSELVKRLVKIEGCKWVKDIYNIGSGFIHLSHQHIYSAFKIDGSTLTAGIRKNDEFIPDSEKVAGTHYMIRASQGITIFIGDLIDIIKDDPSWEDIKKLPPTRTV
jgi:hypothetical protein